MTEKKPLSVEEEVIKIRQAISAFKKERDSFFSHAKTLMKQTDEKIMTGIRRMIEEAEKSNATMIRREAYLSTLQKINANMEETLCNVLLAIRQNEYLQAWYPAQNGFPEMKVAGIHPAKLKSKEKNEKETA